MFRRRAVLSTFFLPMLTLLLSLGTASAQQLAPQSGDAFRINPVAQARSLSMRDGYARALYLYIRNNPTVLDNTEFYVNFLIYLMSSAPQFDCRAAFSNEFERRDYFTQSFSIKEQLRAAINDARIPQRFDIAYSIDTGRYDFTSGNLPFASVRSVGMRETLDRELRADYGAEGCAGQILNGTNVTTAGFPWRFSIVNEAIKPERPAFPFGQSLQLNTNDARALFERFGRQLYAIVGYRFQAANNGERKIQIIPTDGQLFGLSSDAVVRVKSFAHPTLSQPQPLDVTNPFVVKIPDYNIDLNVTFQQQGFRAVGRGTRKDPGTGITQGGTFEVSGSGAVGSSTFIMRLATPGLEVADRSLQQSPTAERYLTLFGGLELEQVTTDSAPASGQAILLQYDRVSGALQEAPPKPFIGVFQPAETASEAPAPAEPETTLDTLPVAPAADGN